MSTAWQDRLEQLRRRPLVFVDDLDDPRLTADDEHHLKRSLRIKPGAPLTISDGRGGWRPARFGAVPEPDGDIVVEPRPHVTLTVGFAPVKGDRSDLVVQKLTELAIDEIVPLRAERSVVRWDDARAAKNLERHRRIVREAAMQSRNPWLPNVRQLTDLEVFLADRPETALADPSGPVDRRLPTIGCHRPRGWVHRSRTVGSAVGSPSRRHPADRNRSNRHRSAAGRSSTGSVLSTASA